VRRVVLILLLWLGISGCQCGPTGNIRPEMTHGALSGITEFLIGIKCQEKVK
jgi:hypothetical protein